MRIAITILQLISCLFLIGVIILQSGKKSGLSAVSGGTESYMSKSGKSLDAKLAKWTKWVALCFVVLTMVLSMIPA